MPVVVAAVSVLVVASCGYWAIAAVCFRRLLRARRGVRAADPGATPPVSILKPVKGTDFEAWDNFVSHCEQDYPDFEVIFGIADANDAAAALIRRLQQRYGGDRVRVIVAPESAPNPKAGLLHELSRRARHDLIVATDSDVRVPRDFLRRVVPLLADPTVGLVTLPYRADRVLGVAAALEALAIETAFLPSVAVARHALRAPFALGAANAVRRDALARIGGFRAVADYLADDYHLGYRMHLGGLRVEIGDTIVATVLGRTSLGAWWLRQVRWARTIRASRRAHYPGMALTFTTPLALLAAATLPPGAWAWAPPVAAVCTRWLVAWKMTGWTGHRALRRRLWLLPVHDLVAVAVWLAGLAGHEVHWRGRRFRFDAGGRLCALARDGRRRVRMAPLHRIGMLVDRTLRRREGIFEFTTDRACLLRLSIRRSDRATLLADGTQVARGERIAVLHLWNERLPAFPDRAASLHWGVSFCGRFTRSLRLLADFLDCSVGLADIRAITGELWLDSSYGESRLAAVMGRFGFESVPAGETGVGGRIALLGRSLHARLLRYAFHGRPFVRGGLALEPLELWISREALMERYLPRAPRLAAAGRPAPPLKE